MGQVEAGYWLQGAGCDDGIAAVLGDRIDLGGLCCPVQGTWAEGMPWHQVAWDIKVAVTHATTAIDSLPSEALGPLARGEITGWESLGTDVRPVAWLCTATAQTSMNLYVSYYSMGVLNGRRR